MKKLHIAIALVLWGFAQSATAQNMYRNYLSTAVPSPESAVSVVHSNGYVYFFQTDIISQKLSVTEIDPLSMLPTGNNRSIQLTFDFMLNGAFECSNGSFVLFGYDNNNSTWNWHPALVVIDQALTTCLSYELVSLFGQFTSGCAGYDISGNEIYVLINNNGKLYAVNMTNPSLFREFTANQNSPFSDFYSDISWDSDHDFFVATGSALPGITNYLYPFVEILQLDIPQSPQGNAVAINVYSYTIEHNNTFITVPEHQAMHVQLNKDDLLLYRDLEEQTNSYVRDIIWLTRINNFWNPDVSIGESYYYLLPDAKLIAKDMIYDDKNNRINFLGVLSHCVDGLVQLLGQADPYSLMSGLHVGQLGGTFSNMYCTSLQPPYAKFYYTDLDMRNLAYNDYNPCFPLLIAGVNGKTSVLTETYDISVSSCDVPLEVQEIKENPTPKPYSISNSPINFTFFPVQCTPNPDNVSVNKLCDETEACSHQFGGNSLQKTANNKNLNAEITVEGNLFFCKGFEDNIQYFLYDITGKLLQKGTTRNGKDNLLIMSNGIYFLKVADGVGNQEVKKVVLL